MQGCPPPQPGAAGCSRAAAPPGPRPTCRAAAAAAGVGAGANSTSQSEGRWLAVSEAETPSRQKRKSGRATAAQRNKHSLGSTLPQLGGRHSAAAPEAPAGTSPAAGPQPHPCSSLAAATWPPTRAAPTALSPCLFSLPVLAPCLSSASMTPVCPCLQGEGRAGAGRHNPAQGRAAAGAGQCGGQREKHSNKE